MAETPAVAEPGSAGRRLGGLTEPHGPSRAEVDGADQVWWPTTERPYPGLRSFERHEHDIFFGRDRHTVDMLKRLQAGRFLAVTGRSGAGKSSLAKVGLLNGLELGLLGDAGARWLVVTMRPNDAGPNSEAGLARDLLGTLAQRLVDTRRSLGRESADRETANRRDDASVEIALLRAQLARGPLGLIELHDEGWIPDGFNLLILVDQFEEMFRPREGLDAEQRVRQREADEAFIALLLGGARLLQEQRSLSRQSEDPAGRLPLFVVLTVRSDFLGDCARFSGLAEAINDSQFLTPRMTRDELKEAIELPGRRFGGRIEPQVTTMLLNDAATDSDQLPVLQHALMRMWEMARARAANGAEPVVTVADYDALGGLKGALRKHLNEIWDRDLSAEQQPIARRLFCSLVDTSVRGRDTRRPLTLGAIAAETHADVAALAPIVAIFRRPGRNFLLPPEPQALGSSALVDISHESLIWQWKELQGWLDDVRRERAILARLKEEAGEWIANGRPNGSLLSGLRLAEARDLFEKRGEALDSEVVEFIRKSRSVAQARVRRVQIAAVAMMILAIAAVGLGLYAFDRQREAAAQRDLAKELQAQAETEKANALAAAQAAEAQTRVALTNQSRYLLSLARQQTNQGDLATALALILEALPRKVGAPDARPYLWEAETALYDAVSGIRELRELRHTDVVWSAAFSPDGTRIVTASQDKTARLWDAATGKELASLEGHQDLVVSAAFSPDGTRVATASDDGTARLWDATTGKELAVPLEHEGYVASAAFSADGSLVLTASADTTARVWESATGKELAVLRGHVHWVNSAELSPDRTRVVTASKDKTARLWETATGKGLFVLDSHDEVNSAVFSADGTRVVTASAEGTASVWDVATGKELAVLRGHEGAVWSAAFSPDGTRVVTSSDDGTARLWDLVTFTEAAVLRGHKDTVWSAAFSPDGRRLVTASSDMTARVWETATGEQLLVLSGHGESVRSALFSPDGTKVVTSSPDNTARVWDVASVPTRVLLRVEKTAVDQAAFDVAGRTVIAYSRNGNTVWRVDSETGQARAEITRFSMNSVSPSTDGSLLAIVFDDGVAELHDLATGAQLVELRDPEGRITSAAFSPDGARVATTSAGGSARIWDPRTGKELAVMKGHEAAVVSAAFSTDGGRIATASEDDTARVWDSADGKQLAVLGKVSRQTRAREVGVHSAVFSPDGMRIATAYRDGMARIWNAVDGVMVAEVAEHEQCGGSIAFSPDGSRLLGDCVDDTVREWRSADGSKLAELRGHEQEIQSAAYSPDATRVVTASLDGTARLWDALTGEQVAVLRGHERTVFSANFSPDGTRVVTASEDGTVRVWRVFRTTQDLIDQAWSILPRELTPEERKAFYID
jgi:WD40 repeat protein